jgi:solute:Na+ symporter, SSS family
MMIIFGVAVSVFAVLAVGLFVARKVDGDSTNFLVAGRTLALPLSAAGLMGQAVDSNATLGNTDLAASFGFWAGVTLPLGLGICLLLTGLFFARRMNAMQLLTLPDFYRRLYGRGVEVSASVLMIFSFCILLAGNLVAGGLLFEAFLGTSYEVGILLIVGVVLAYTITGGMFSDAYTAFIQMCITVTASAALLVWVWVEYGLSSPDGMGAFDLGQLSDPAQGAAVNWGTLVALGIGDIVAIDFMQRIFSAKSPDVARRACFVGAAGTAIVGIPYGLVALASAGIFGDDEVSGPVLFHLLDNYAPVWLAILVLSGIVAASCSTANGAILGTAAVAVRNVAGFRRQVSDDGHDPLLRTVRVTMLPVVGIAVLFAIRVPETGILLTLAFDLMLACLVVPFILGHYWSRSTREAAIAAIAVGFVVRLGLFVVTPTIFGADNTLLYVENSVVGAGFDGYPTFLGGLASLVAFVGVALLTRREEPVALGPVAEGDEELGLARA